MVSKGLGTSERPELPIVHHRNNLTFAHSIDISIVFVRVLFRLGCIIIIALSTLLFAFLSCFFLIFVVLPQVTKHDFLTHIDNNTNTDNKQPWLDSHAALLNIIQFDHVALLYM